MIFKLNTIFFIILAYSQSIECARVALCTVATGKYARFVKNLVETTNKNFLKNHQVTIFILTDQLIPIDGNNIVTIRWPHKRAPFAKIMRFEAYKNICPQLAEFDYIYACDANLIFTEKIGDEILTKAVGVICPKNNQPLFKHNHKSNFFLQQSKIGGRYYTTSFYGGKKQDFIKLINNCSTTIQDDLKKETISNRHDEAQLNYYFLENPPSIILLPHDYCSSDIYTSTDSSNYKLIAMKKNRNPIQDEQLFLSNREFVILIPSYNNLRYFKKNLDSVFRQNYDKYRVIYIDDNSPDGTGEAVAKYIQERGKSSITTLIRNSERKLAMANIYNTIHQYCHDHEIIVMLDGDDELADETVLTYLNDIYKKDDIWFTYGNIWFKHLAQLGPWSKKIEDAQIELNRFREWDGAATHLRTFYAWLFKKINKDDLMINGEFFKMTYDVAMFMPILEMVGYHHCFIEKPLYLYNDENPISDHRVDCKLQIELDKYIRNSLKKYSPITKLSYFEKILLKDSSLSPNITNIAAILNDLIAEVFSVYPDLMQRKLILEKIDLLQPNYIDKSNLLQISIYHNYYFLENYLLSINQLPL